MKPPLHILHLEDDENDARLIRAVIEDGGIACTVTRVETRPDFIAALEAGDIDLILADFSLPAFDGFSAINIVLNQFPDIPLIIVSGTLGEEEAIESLQCGATDYVLKERLGRLVSSVQRAMKGVEERAARRRLEARFIEAQKMEVIGQLAGGVAHDFNNILAVIIGNCELLASEIGPDSSLRVYCEDIRHASDRAVGLIRQLLVFSRKHIVQPTVLDLNTVLIDMGKMLRRLVVENIELTVIPENKPVFIRADSGYVGQVLMNLAVNARDAMPSGGKLTIMTKQVMLDQDDVVGHAGVLPGEYIMLAVSDTGTGITEEVKQHMFEAFYTTKPAIEGTGLGLATCQTIVHQSGGYIQCESEVGKGTTFEVYFPRADLSADATGSVDSLEALPRGTETLLVVEDEPSLNNLACKILGSQGYEVHSAANGQEALQVVNDHRGTPFHLVITDVIMPLMGGKVMADRLRATYPDLKILFTSGYTESAITEHDLLDEGVAFLPKPYTSALLVHHVRVMLDA